MATDVKGQQSYVEWSTIIGGAMLATALTLVLVQFGAAAGIADLDALRRDVPTPGKLVAAGVYVLLVQVLASVCGGYVAGRMRAPISGSPVHEREIRDGMHGLLVWATGTVMVAVAVFASAAFLAHATGDANAETAKEVLKQRHTVSVILAFSAAATALVAAVGSWVAATIGGDHRDNTVDHSHRVSFRKGKK
ncbi:MAG: hypothetical protein ACAH80_09835 [Alphaproteobacteria bacterium]